MRSVIQLGGSADRAGASSGVRYPSIGKLALVYTVVGALASARYLLSFGHLGRGPEGWTDTLGCIAWFYPWAFLTPVVFRIESRFPLGAPGWPRRVLMLAAISVPMCAAASPLMMGSLCASPLGAGQPDCVAAKSGRLARRAADGRDHVLVQRGRGLLPANAVPASRAGAACLAPGAREIKTGSEPESVATGDPARAAQSALPVQQPAEHFGACQPPTRRPRAVC